MAVFQTFLQIGSALAIGIFLFGILPAFILYKKLD